MSKRKQNNNLEKSIIVFVIAAILAIIIILSKGHIFGLALVNANAIEEDKLTQTIEVSVEKEYLSSTDKEKEDIIVKIDGETVEEGIELVSSDENVIKIEKGKIVAVKDGKATITAKYGELADSVDVHVITPIKKMTFTTTNKNISVGKDLQMKLQLSPSDASIETIKYKSSDEDIAKVNSNGIVTGVSKGKVTITVTDLYTGKEGKVDLTIK